MRRVALSVTPRRIVWLIDSLRWGGAERLAVDFASCPPAGLEVLLVSMQAECAPPLAAALRGLRWQTLDARSRHDVRAWRRLGRLLHDWRPVLLHAHLRSATLWAAAAGARRRIPVVATLHVMPAAGEPMISALERLALNHGTTRVLALSRAQADAWQAAGVNARRLCILPNGVAVPPVSAGRETLRRERGLPAGAPVVLTVAVVRRLKGWPLWVETVARLHAALPEARFVWVGDGPDAAALRIAVAARGLAQVTHLVGARDDVANWLALADLFLFPSEEEALPTVVLEAMAAGLPVVAGRLAVLDALLPAPRPAAVDAEGYARACLDLLNDPPARAEYAARMRARYTSEFTRARWHERLCALYDEVENTARSGSQDQVQEHRSSAADQRHGRKAGGVLAVRPVAPRILMVEFFAQGGLWHYGVQLATALAAQGAAITLLTGRRPEMLPPATVRLLPRLLTWNCRATPRLPRLARLAHAIQYVAAWSQIVAWAARLRPTHILLGDLEHRCDDFFVRLLQRRGHRVAAVWHNVEAFDRRPGHALVRSTPWRDRLAQRLNWVFVHGPEAAARLTVRSGCRPWVIAHGDQAGLVAAAGPDPGLEARFALPRDRPVALLFGTLTKYKGVGDALAALALLPESERPVLWIAGFAAADADLDGWQRTVTATGLAASVRWDVRYVPLAEVAWYFRRADFVVLPYRTASQSGVAHLAWTLRRPLLVTAVGGLPEVIAGGSAGVVVAPGDPAALAAGMASMVARWRKGGDMPTAVPAAPPPAWDAAAATLLTAFTAAASSANKPCLPVDLPPNEATRPSPAVICSSETP